MDEIKENDNEVESRSRRELDELRMNDYKFYLHLTEEESIRYANKVIEETKDIEQLEDILLHLALFTNGKCLKPQYFRLAAKGIFYPCEIYLHANEQVADELIKLIENNSELSIIC